MDELEEARIRARARARLQASGGEEPDKYRQQALDDEKAAKERGTTRNRSFLRRGMQGATFNAADEILAGLNTIPEMIRQGTIDPREGYKFAKAREDLDVERMREEQGIAGDVAEIGGSIGSGAGLARQGFTLLRNPGAASAAMKVGTGLAEGIGYGAVSGGMDGNSAGERFNKALVGGAVGGAVGGGVPLALSVGRGVLSPAVSRLMPGRTAEKHAARAILESGRSTQSIEDGLRQATDDGQGAVWTLADELGNPGQRQLSAVARAPGPGRTQAVNTLEGRQDGQARRVAAQVAEALEAPRTRQQDVALRKAQRSEVADEMYDAARGSAGTVDVSRALQAADETIRPGVPGEIREDSVRGVVRRARGYLADAEGNTLSNFDDVLAAKVEIDNLIENAKPSQQRVLTPIRNALDDALAQSSPDYAQARNVYRARSQGIEAVDEGYAAAQRGRSEDTIERFNSMGPDARSGFRTGYADRLIENAQGPGRGANAARPMTASGVQDELQAITPPTRRDMLARRLGRENTMFETRGQAIGGSKTADNLADARAVEEDPSIVVDLLQGNVLPATRRALRGLYNQGMGMPQTVRTRLAEILLSTADSNPDLRTQMIETARRLDRNARLGSMLLRGGSAGSGQETQRRIR